MKLVMTRLPTLRKCLLNDPFFVAEKEAEAKEKSAQRDKALGKKS